MEFSFPAFHFTFNNNSSKNPLKHEFFFYTRPLPVTRTILISYYSSYYNKYQANWATGHKRWPRDFNDGGVSERANSSDIYEVDCVRGICYDLYKLLIKSSLKAAYKPQRGWEQRVIHTVVTASRKSRGGNVEVY